MSFHSSCAFHNNLIVRVADFSGKFHQVFHDEYLEFIYIPQISSNYEKLQKLRFVDFDENHNVYFQNHIFSPPMLYLDIQTIYFFPRFTTKSLILVKQLFCDTKHFQISYQCCQLKKTIVQTSNEVQMCENFAS